MSIKEFPHDLGWRWQIFGGRPLLVTDGGGAMVVLAGAYQSPIQTRDPENGMLRNIDPSDHVAKIIASAPEVRRHAQSLINGIDIGLVRIESSVAARIVGSDHADKVDDSLQAVLTGLRLGLKHSGAA